MKLAIAVLKRTHLLTDTAREAEY